jgi:pimeloyl-ACP methyl ester carboxylesterase
MPPIAFDLKLPSGTLRAHRHGDGAGRLVLCIHGLSAHSRTFDHIGPALAAPGTTVVALDLRGRGWSDITPAGSYGWERHARDVWAAADALGAATFDYVGHSMGAYIGLELVRQVAARVRKLVLIDVIGVPEPASLIGIAASVRRLGSHHASADAYVATMRQMGHIESWSPFWDTYYRYELVAAEGGGVTPRTDRTAVLEDVAYGSLHRPRDLWPGITMESLLVRAARPLGAGFLVPAADRDAYLATVPGARAVEIDANHFGIVTHDATAAAIAGFLA